LNQIDFPAPVLRNETHASPFLLALLLLFLGYTGLAISLCPTELPVMS
jgi:cytochrome bd ubiquinol oxidase subunit II